MSVPEKQVEDRSLAVSAAWDGHGRIRYPMSVPEKQVEDRSLAVSAAWDGHGVV
ncbi:hypothetical protein HPP92_010132 [Vanilla planifolia]|uniref:Uncharacterized protein n=1 Tax=Vanilla planifolia TaxID=51239 RepID=A0A835UX92_VANPL|nr:hypothetical protein HPP92_010132 [Vanilla planifolia]